MDGLVTKYIFLCFTHCVSLGHHLPGLTPVSSHQELLLDPRSIGPNSCYTNWFVIYFQANETVDYDSQSGLHHLAALLCTVLLSNLDPKSPQFLLTHNQITSNHKPNNISTNHETSCPELANQNLSSFTSVSVPDDLISLELDDDSKRRKFSCNTRSERLPHGCILVISSNFYSYLKIY